jgi:amylosucrase
MAAVPAPDDVQRSVADELAGLSPERRTSFRLRLDRWWEDLSAGLAEAYPQPAALAGTLVQLAARA